ncbi:MAG: hypothetical protein GY711_18565 [bacterium]|nr:hypothetical protein [bacterium]
MKKLMLPLMALALSATSTAGVQDESAVGFAKGRFLPDLELPTIDGERTVRLSSLRGKKLLLVQFASW